MAYKALYRTYRPKSFEEVAGQTHIVKTLQHAVEQNKIAHAYLFCGPRGTGKTSIAKIFAKTINCESLNQKPCLVCDNCKEVQEGNHPDIIEIDAASNNGVEEVRSLIEKVKYAPLLGKYKIYIIDEVHMMSKGAFNALLKTIEEPPAHVIFILATTEPQKVLPTIISRCQRFDFTKVPKDKIIERINTVLKSEDITCDDEVIRIIAQLADGGLRDALSILDQCIAYARDNVKVHHINEIYGITTKQEKLELFQLVYQKNALELLNRVDMLIEKGIDIKRLTVDLIELLKESIIFEYTKDSTLLHELESKEALEIIEQRTIKDRFSMIHILMDSYDKYRTAANIGSYFEVCLLQMLDINESAELNKECVLSKEKKEQPTRQQNPKIEHVNEVSRETFVKEPLLNSNEDTNKFEEKVAVLEENMPDLSMQVEVIQENQKNKSAIPLEEEFVIALLAGATKPEKIADSNQFKNIENYVLDFRWARFASLLKNGVIVGSGSNYIVLSVDSQAEANEINEKDSLNEFGAFIVELLGKNKKIFAISKNQQNIIIQNFKDRMINGTLPDPIQIEDVLIKKEEPEKSSEELVLQLFGEKNISITEE